MVSEGSRDAGNVSQALHLESADIQGSVTPAQQQYMKPKEVWCLHTAVDLYPDEELFADSHLYGTTYTDPCTHPADRGVIYNTAELTACNTFSCL